MDISCEQESEKKNFKLLINMRNKTEKNAVFFRFGKNMLKRKNRVKILFKEQIFRSRMKNNFKINLITL